MSHGNFTTFGSIDHFDHASRTQREREKELGRQERAERWLTTRLRGQTYNSLEELTDAALFITRTFYARPLDEVEKTLIVRACNSLFSGFVDPGYFAGKISIVRGESITFVQAA